MTQLSLRAMLFLCLCVAGPARLVAAEPEDVPKAHDPRLVVERFAVAPDIVHPVNMTFDGRGRLLVIESHTHFRPPNYRGPEHDRVRVLEDTDGDGKADRFTTFFEGTRFTMDIEAHPDGTVYLATRNEILRLSDSDGDGKADRKERIVHLDTKGNYPHNGLSGLCFDSKGDLFFGMGENLGAEYKLIGSDGATLAEEGEGGNVFWCTADGKKLRRVATGFWNPFGICADIFGRMFAVDNDPDAMPPCRMMHVVEGADFGYQFRYGRSGRHPFQAWNGQLPGTLPMMTGTGEAPCEVLSYESDGLPAEYVGDLLVTSWADHRLERYSVRERGASVVAERKPFVLGGKDFRPVGLVVAPDGSLFVSDWVLRDYNLHGRGAVWHVRPLEPNKSERPKDARTALTSGHRPVREAAARELAKTETGRTLLRQRVNDDNVRIAAAALTALHDADDRKADLDADAVPALRALAVQMLAERGENVARYLDPKQPPAVRFEAIQALHDAASLPQLMKLLTDDDSYLRHAAVRQLARHSELLAAVDLHKLPDARQRVGVLLAHRMSGKPEAVKQVAGFLADRDSDVRFLAAKWVADQQLSEERPRIVEALKDPRLSVRLYQAYSTALARIDRQDVSEARMADFFFSRLTDPASSPTLKIAALRLVPTAHKKMTLDVLTRLLKDTDADVQREAVRALGEHPDPKRLAVLLDVARSDRYADATRAEALVGVADRSPEILDDLLAFARGDNASLRDEALRALAQTKLAEAQRAALQAIVKQHPSTSELVARALGQPFVKDRPKPDDASAWLNRLEGPADADAGRRVFFHSRLGYCARCHRVDGRGADVGPDLSDAGRTERRHLLESILMPDNLVAPHYQVWNLATEDGKVHTGMLIHTHLDEYTYLDPKGTRFKLNTRDIAESRPARSSIMPSGLPDLLTDQELRDVLAFLESRRPDGTAEARPTVKGQRVFSAGHSFHVFMPSILRDMTQAAGITDHVQVGVQSIGGSRVIQHWNMVEEKNKARQTLREGKADVLTLSPIYLPDEGIENFVKLALEHNPDARVLVQEFWLPYDVYELNYQKKRPEKVDRNTRTPKELHDLHAAYFKSMDDEVQSLNRKYGKPAVFVVPVGQAVIALREKIIAGEAPGLKMQDDLFTDAIGHVKAPVQALTAYCHFAVIYRRSPVGLPMPPVLARSKNPEWDEKLNRLLQELAWDAVTRHPLSGVKAEGKSGGARSRNLRHQQRAVVVRRTAGGELVHGRQHRVE